MKIRVAVLALLLAGCSVVPHEPWRLKIDPDTRKVQPPSDTPDDPPVVRNQFDGVAHRSWEQYESFDLGVVEFDDNGDAWHAQQEQYVLDRIRERAFDTGATIVLYAHGWHHNAKPDNGNIESFRNVLQALSHQPDQGVFCANEQPKEKKTRLVGIYVGWRGEARNDLLGKWLSFWSRKKAAHRVGGARDLMSRDRDPNITPPSVAFLQELHNIYRKANDSRRPGDARSFTTLITTGHSLGGALLFSAIDYLRTHKTAASPSYDQKETSGDSVTSRYEGIGDVMALVNPAFEAKRYVDFNRIARSGNFSEEQGPVLMVVSSRKDKPNRIAFRIGRVFSTAVWPKNWLHPILSINPIGFAPAYRTHDLEVATDCTTCRPDLDKLQVTNWYPKEIDPLSDKPGDFALAAPHTYGLEYEMKLKPHGAAVGVHAPYMVVSAGGKIIHDHNDIFNSQLATFLLQFTSTAARKNVLARCEVKEKLQ